MNDKAQLHVLEVVIVAGMLFMALFFVKNMDVSSYTTIEKENRLEVIGRAIFDSLESQPDPYGKWDNLLVSYLANEHSGLLKLNNYIISHLPEGSLFRLTVIDMDKLFHNASASLEDCTYTLLGANYWFGEEARISKIVVIDGYVNEIILSMWYNVGG
jgi:hypothetical protein